MGKSKAFFITLFLLIHLSVFGQELKVEGYFLQDSARLGERVSYVLKATYPPEKQVIFPDSTYNYGEMEYLGKKTYISYTQDSLTQDSVIYYLSNFSLDPIRNFALPAYEVLRYDSLVYFAEEDELFLKLTIDEIPDQPIFRDNDHYQNIRGEFNYIYFTIALVALLVILILTYIIFGKNIRQQYLIWIEKRRLGRFNKRWDKASRAFIQKPEPDRADELLGLWKHYLELVSDKPYREWTASEIALDLPREGILEDLRGIELIIYAGRQAEDLPQICQNLKADCLIMYNKKIARIHERK
ncbi:hypothetical protein [Anditalea andensis]|uniref:Uncharacterized protein n=1 Tax=Anditalea andensis TaxID=1048983 RepID=A0A074L0P7_9BACT|nr:hypothetical protein [Anditalea andensis]KEO74724.1 hypothetical protein EL17_03340 [Anditalea andensis]